jgi:hypothetical protein
MANGGKALIMAAVFSAVILCVTACKEEVVQEQVAPEKAYTFAEIIKWQGRWDGAHGARLSIKQDQGENFVVKFDGVDYPGEFPAIARPDGLAFMREEGVEEVLHHGDGFATGVKWLLEKSDCLYVKIGEGFCRD